MAKSNNQEFTDNSIDRSEKYNKKVLWGAFIMTLVGLIGIFVFGLSSLPNWNKFAAFVGTALLWSAASFTLGGIIGFIFGIPRAELSEISSSESSTEKAKVSTSYRANTNLEQISDWLTKILVGVGLTQVTEIYDKLNSIIVVIAKGLAVGPSSNVIASSLICYYSILGFLTFYLSATLVLRIMYTHADVALDEISENDVNKINEFSKIENEKTLELDMDLKDYVFEEGNYEKQVQPAKNIMNEHSLKNLKTLKGILIWARAAKFTSQFLKAELAYEKALQISDKFDIRLEYAQVLSKHALSLKNTEIHKEAISEFEKVFERLSENDSTVSYRKVYEGIIFNYLYIEPPEGFRKAIKWGNEFFNNHQKHKDVPMNGYLWFLMACGYGQKHAYEKNKEDKEKKSDDELNDITKKVIEFAEKAVREANNGQYWKRMLKEADGSDDKDEDDLTSLKDNPELKKLLS